MVILIFLFLETRSSKLEECLIKFLNSLPANNFLQNWTIVTFNLNKVCCVISKMIVRVILLETVKQILTNTEK